MTDNKPTSKAKAVSRTSRPKSGGANSGKGVSKGNAAKKGGDKAGPEEASQLIDQRISELEGWRGATLARMRALILEAAPAMTEEWKWNNPVWSHDGIVCTGEAYKKVVKLTFPKGAALADPTGLFNSSLEGNVRRAIDIAEGETVSAGPFKALVKAAVARNAPTAKTTSKAGLGGVIAGSGAAKAGPVKLLSGGNPQIAKADGDAPVQAYIAAMPGWKSEVGRRVDAIVTRTVPGVRKAVKWNSPFYGLEGQGWFLSFHVLTRYVKFTFFNGVSLRPVPPGGTPKSGESRWIDIYEDDELDEARITSWVKQAARLPGWTQ